MKLNLILPVLVCALSGCANFQPVDDVQQEVARKNQQSRSEFNFVRLAQTNYLGELKQDNLPEAYWSYQVRQNYLRPISIEPVLAQLADELHLTYIAQPGPGATAQAAERPVRRKFKFKGTVEQYINFLSQQYDTFIHLDKRTLTSKAQNTETFDVLSTFFKPGSASYGYGEDTLSGSVSSAAPGEAWADIESYIQSVLGESEGQDSYTYLQELSQVTLTTSYRKMHRIKNYIKNYNQESSRQVRVDYKVIRISREEIEKLDIGASSDSIKAGTEILENAGATLERGFDHFTLGLSAELQKQGGVIEASGMAIGLNKKPMPIQIKTKVAYLKSKTFEHGEDGGPDTTTLEPGDEETGLSLVAVPRIIDKERIGLSIGYGQSDLELKGFADEDQENQLQYPTVNKRSIISDVIVRSGEERLVTLYTENKFDAKDQARLVGKGMSQKNTEQVIALIVKVSI